jgi:hypothetical protein
LTRAGRLANWNRERESAGCERLAPSPPRTYQR